MRKNILQVAATRGITTFLPYLNLLWLSSALLGDVLFDLHEKKFHRSYVVLISVAVGLARTYRVNVNILQMRVKNFENYAFCTCWRKYCSSWAASFLPKAPPASLIEPPPPPPLPAPLPNSELNAAKL